MAKNKRSSGRPGPKDAGPPPGPDELARLMAKGGFQLSAEQRDRLWAFHEYLRAADKKLNLTRIRAFAPMVEKHYIDSLLPAVYTDLPSPLMDLGSGGGFPGIPLAIMHPGTRFVLVEGRRRRAGFLMGAAQELGLKNVDVVARKLNPDDAMDVAGVITRAFSAIPGTLERIDASLRPGGRALFMKGPNCDDEIAAVAETEALAHFRLADDIHYLLPISGDERRLVVYEKSAAAEPVQPSLASFAPATEITSDANPRFKHWRKLTDGRGVKKHGETLLSGSRYIDELCRDRPERVLGLLLGPDDDPPPAAAGVEALELFRLGSGLLAELDPMRGPLAWLRVPELPAWAGTPSLPEPAALAGAPDRTAGPLVLFLPLQLPDNLGAVLRTAEALGAAAAVLLDEAAHPFQPKALRAAGPAAFRLPLYSGPALGELTAAAAGMELIALDAEGEPLPAVARAWTAAGESAEAGAPLGLVLGMEGPGLGALAPAVRRVAIPMAPAAESLNAAVACGIALYALLGQRRA